MNEYEDTLDQVTAPAGAAAPPAPNAYLDTLNEIDSSSETGMRKSLIDAAATPPDRAAQTRRLSLKLAVPPSVIDRNFDEYTKRDALDQPYAAISAQTPHTAAWLQDPGNAAIAKDDLQQLGTLEWLVTAPQRAFAQGVNAVRAGQLRTKLALHGELTQAEHDEMASAQYQAQNGGALGADGSWFRTPITGAAKFLPTLFAMAKYGVAGALSTGAAGALAGSVLPGPGTIAGGIAGAGYGLSAGLLYGGARVGFDLATGQAHDEYSQIRDEVGRPLDPNVVKAAAIATGIINAGLMVVPIEKLAESVPGYQALTASVTRDAVATALKSPTVRSALADAVKSFGGNVTTATATMIGQRAVTILGGEIAKATGKAGAVAGQLEPGNVDLYKQPAVPNADGSVSTVDSFSVNIDGKEVLLPTVTPDGRHLSEADALAEYQKTGRQLGVFDSPESATAFAKQLHEDYAAGKYASGSKYRSSSAIFSDLLYEGVSAASDFALVSTAGPALGLAHARYEAKLAAGNADYFTALGEGVKASKVFQRLPDAAQAFIASATKDGPVETVYAPIDTWQTYWQSKGVDPAEMAQAVTGSRDAFDQATRTGEDLAIPTAAYATKIAPTEHNAYFANELRLAPEEMNAREGKAFEQELQQQQAQQQADVAAQQREAAAKPVRDAITTQLEGAGLERSVAESYASLYEQTFQTLGERAGLDPTALFEQYGLTIERPELATDTQPGETQLNQQPRPEFVPVGGEASENADRAAATTTDQQTIDTLAQTGEADPAKATLREMRRTPGAGPVRVLYQRPTETQAFRDWFGTSKVVDESGQPRVAYHGTNKDFETFSVEKAGTGRGSKEEHALFFSLTPDTANRSAEVMGANTPESTGQAFAAQMLKESLGIETPEVGSVVYPVYLKLENPAISAMQFYDSRQMEKEIKAARKAGHDGVLFPQLNQIGEQDTVAVFSPTQVKSALGNAGTFDPNNPSILNQDVRGSIRIGPNQQMKIELLRKADLSTFLHETGHFFLEVMRDLGNRADAAPGIKADLATLDAWLVDEDHTGAGYSVKQHEQFARGFEAYLMEGKAPSAELRTVFARFRAWLVGTYRSLKNLNVDLTPEVRSVFDRLLASDEAIHQAEDEGRVAPLFTDAAMAGMSEDAFSAYKATVQAASDRARDDLQAKLLGDLQREQQAWWKSERETMRTQVASELGEQPVFRALAAIQKGTRPDGTPLVEGVEAKPLKLAKADLVDRYPPNQLAELRRRQLYAAENGVHPDVVAQLVGLSSGDELVKALLTSPSLKAATEAETDRRMTAKHGDLLLSGQLHEQAQAAVFGEHRQTVIQAELKALTAGMVKGTIPPAAAINAHAEQRIAATRVRDLRPGQFLMAARRASQRAFDLLATHQDRAGAVQAKQQELVNLAVYREATKARDAAESTVDYLRSFDAAAKRERIGKAGGDYLEQIDGLRERFDLARVTLKSLDRRAALAKWAQGQEAATGLPVNLPDELLNDARRTNYKDLTVDELHGVRDGVRMIEHLATLKNKLLKAQGQRELSAVASEAVASIDAHAKGERSATRETRLPGSATTRNIGTFFASHLKLATILREMDGFKDGGVLWDHIMRPLNEAANDEAVRNEQATIALTKLFADAYKGDETTLYRKTFQPGINDSLTKMARLMIALNWGNEGNRQRLRDGYHWTDDQVGGILNTLDQRDWKFVQGVWDHINTYWPEIAAKEKRVTGVEPEKVLATPVPTAFGEMAGGYFPIKYDHQLSARAAANLEGGFAEGVKQAAYVRATTQRGHTEARAARVAEPLRLDFGVITEHVQQVIHDLTHHEPLLDVSRILAHRDVADTIYARYGDIAYDQLKGAIRDIAFGNTPAPGWYKTLNAIRANTVTATLGWNVVTSLLHTLQISRGMARVGPGYVLKGLGRWAVSARNAENSVGWIEGQSDMMRLRWKTQQRELNEVRNQVGLDRGKVSAAIHDTLAKAGVDPGAMPAIAESYFYAIRRIVQFAEIPTWLGAYEKAAAGGDHARAVALADQAVIDSMGSGQIKDLAAVQRAPMARLLTTFYDYHNAVYQQAYELVKSSESPGHKLMDATLLLFVPVALGATLHHLSAGGQTSASNQPTAVGELSRDSVDYALNMFIGLRELSGALTGRDYQGPGGLKVIPTARNFLYQGGELASKVAQGKDVGATPGHLARASNEMGGALFGYPAKQVDRTARGLQALWDGKTNDLSAVIFGPPKESR